MSTHMTDPVTLWGNGVTKTFEEFEKRYNSNNVMVCDLYIFQSCLKILLLAPTILEMNKDDARKYLHNIQTNYTGKFKTFLDECGIHLENLLCSVGCWRHRDTEGSRRKWHRRLDPLLEQCW